MLAREHPELGLELGLGSGTDALPAVAPPAVPALPTKRGFDARAVWRAYAGGRPHVAASRAQEVAAVVVRSREGILAGAAAARQSRVRGAAADADDADDADAEADAEADAALREVCAALASWGAAGEQAAALPRLSVGARSMAEYLDTKGLAVPQDLGVLPAEVLRSLVVAQAL